MKVTISEVDGTTRVEVDPGGLPPGPGPLDNLLRMGWTLGYDAGGLWYWARFGPEKVSARTPEKLRDLCVERTYGPVAEDDPAS